jgi:ATP-dependent Zn protease
MRHPFKTNIFWFILIITFFLAYRLVDSQESQLGQLGWGEFISYTENGLVDELSINGDKLKLNSMRPAVNTWVKSSKKKETLR